MENMELNFYKNKKVLITGCTGFKGTWLSYLLYHFGAKIFGFGLKDENSDFFYSLSMPKKFKEFKVIDIKNQDLVNDFLINVKPEFIFHLAAQPLVAKSYLYPKETFQVNFNGTLNLLESVRINKLSVKIVIITTDKVYENRESGNSFREEDKLGGRDPYSASKSIVEILSHSYESSFFCQNDEVKIVTARAGNVFGGGDWSENRLVTDIAKSFLLNKQLIIRAKSSVRPWQFVLEPIYGYLLYGIFIDLNQSYPKSLNFGPSNDQFLSVYDFIYKFKKLVDIDNIIYQKNNIKESKFLSLNSERASQILGWKPNFSIQESINYTEQWYINFKTNKVDQEKLIKNQIEKFLNQIL